MALLRRIGQRIMAVADEVADEAHGVALELRIGLASGPAVGGVIGRQRILFDLWGSWT